MLTDASVRDLYSCRPERRRRERGVSQAGCSFDWIVKEARPGFDRAETDTYMSTRACRHAQRGMYPARAAIECAASRKILEDYQCAASKLSNVPHF